MNVLEKIMDLTKQALSEFDELDYKLSKIIRKAIRIARLRNDYSNLLWLEREMIPVSPDNKTLPPFVKEMAPHFSQADYKKLSTEVTDQYIAERRTAEVDKSGIRDKGNIAVHSVPEMEKLIETFETSAQSQEIPQGLTPIDTYFADISKSNYKERLILTANFVKQILERISHRVHEFLSITEKQLVYGQVNSDIFEKYRQYVDERLKQITPETLDQFVSAYRRLQEGDTESRSQALLSCRRILKSLADNLYPAREGSAIGSDGKERKLTENKYVARLWQFINEKLKGKASGKLLLAQITDLGNRIDRLYELACKGTHDNVSEFEVNQCVIQTYLTVGDILRIVDGDSGIYAKTPDIPLDS